MAVKGFNIGGSINRYDFNSLVNKEGAVTADMLGSDVTTQLTTMSSNISTLQSQVATLNDGYTQLNTAVALKAGNGEPLAGYCYMSVRSTLGSTATVTFANNRDHNRYDGLLLVENNMNSGAVYAVGYKAAQSPFATNLAGTGVTVLVDTNGDLKVALPAWSKAVLISTEKFD